MNIRFKWAQRDFRHKEKDEVHVRGVSSIVLCQPNLVGACFDHTNALVTCPECIAIRDGVQQVTRTTDSAMTHGTRSLPTRSRAGITWCSVPFAWRSLLAQESYALHEVKLMRPVDCEVNCMTCVVNKTLNN